MEACYLCGTDAVTGPHYEKGEPRLAVRVECPTCDTYIISLAAKERVAECPKTRPVLSRWSRRHAETGEATPFRILLATVDSADAESRVSNRE